MLTLEAISAGYRRNIVLRELSLACRRGAVTAVIGLNGTGKSTLLKVASGEVPVTAGRVFVDTVDVTNLGLSDRARLGIATVMQGGRVFPSMSVEENLHLAAMRMSAADRKRAVEETLRGNLALNERRDVEAGLLSGGERQLLAVASAVIVEPKLLLLDEPSAGLSENRAAVVAQTLIDFLHRRQPAILLIEQNLSFVAAVADRVMALKDGKLHFVADKLDGAAPLEQRLDAFLRKDSGWHRSICPAADDPASQPGAARAAGFQRS